MNKVPKKIYLIGFMGSGKSTVGLLLSKKMGLNFTDLDEMIEDYCLCSISELFSKLGEHLFREIETKILTETQDLSDVVISLGGGTPCFNNNIEFINQQGISIYLQLSTEALVERLVNEKDKRPLISQAQNKIELENLIGNKLSQRSHFYEKAHYIVNGDQSIEHILLQINDLINS